MQLRVLRVSIHTSSVQTFKIVQFVCVLAAILCLWREGTAQTQRWHFGDDQEYLTLTTSFMLHHSPEFEPGDQNATLAALPPMWRESLAKKFSPGPAPGAYYPASNRKYYAFHFFTYSAAVAPVRKLLEGGPDASRAHQYFNLIALSLSLASMLLVARPSVFWVMLALGSLTPVLWFTTYASTETFVFSLCLAAASCHLADRGVLAISLVAIAATQYQPLALLALFLCVQWLWTNRSRWRRRPFAVLGALASAAVVFVPGIFYYAHFGVPNLIAREGLVSLRFVSFRKFAGLLVDLNGGLLIYAPGVLLFLVVTAGWAIAHARRDAWNLGLLLTVLLTLAASTVQRNWNHPTFGISRYALYGIAPALMFIGCEVRRRNVDWRALGVLLVVALGLQVLVHRANGWLAYHGNDAGHHSPAAMYVLERWPWLYAPHSEIFCERSGGSCWPDPLTGETRADQLPVLYVDAGYEPRKLLASRCDEDKVLRARFWTVEQRTRIHDAMRHCRGSGTMYIDF